jgi:hypothetical protein
MKECTAQPTSRHAKIADSRENPMLAAALSLAHSGFSVLPIHSINSTGACTCNQPDCSHPGKHPRTQHGYKDATTDEAIIRTWWIKYPSANLGIATGAISNLLVLDVDAKIGGLESLRGLEDRYGSLEIHRQVASGGGGKHFYFQSQGLQIKCKIKILPGIDVIGESGSIVAPPSVHVSGKRYTWANELPIQRMPQWLITLIADPIHCSPSPTRSTDIPEGKRNSTLLSIAGFLKAKGLSDVTIENILPHVNEHACTPPLSDHEVQSLAQGMIRYESWGAIRPLLTNKAQVIPMTPAHIPSPLKEWVADICERMQLPLEFVAAPAIVALSTIIGRKMAIQPLRQDDWSVIPNLWGMLVADPGSMKSAALTQAMKPLLTLEKKARASYEKTCQEYAKKEKDMALEVECLKQSLKMDWGQGMGQNIKEKKDHLQRLTQQDGTVLKEKRHKTNDPTIEKLALILKDNPQGILLLRDELSGWLEGLSKNGREGSREFYLEAWNGNGSFSMDRINRGSTFTESICLAVFGGIQPQKLQQYMDRYENAQGQDGFLERFQVAVYPDPIQNWQLIDRKPDHGAFQQVMELFERLDAIEMNETSPHTVSFSYEAQILANDWRSRLEHKILDPELSAARKSYVSKYRSLMPSLALIFEVMRMKGPPLDVSAEATKLAIQWVDLLETHMHKILCMGQTPESSALLLVKKIKYGELYDGMKIRELYRKSWKGMTTPEKTLETLHTLEKHGYIRIKKQAGLGGTSESILINPNFWGAV